MPSIEEQKKKRVVQITTIITCSIMISIMATMIKTKFVETLDDPNSLTAMFASIAAFAVCLFSGYAAGRGCGAIWRAPYEK